MTVEKHKFIANVEDELGWEYPEALVVILDWSKSGQDTGTSKDIDETYMVKSEVEAIAYTANFFANEKTQKDGKRSRPIYSSDNDELATLLSVDLTTEESLKALSTDMAPLDKMFKLIELDVERRFASEDSKDLVII